MKIGDRVKDRATGKIYIIKMEFDNETLFLEGENGLGRRLTGKGSLRRTCEKLDDIKSWSNYILVRRGGWIPDARFTCLAFTLLKSPWSHRGNFGRLMWNAIDVAGWWSMSSFSVQAVPSLAGGASFVERLSIRRSSKIGIIRATGGSGTKEARNGRDNPNVASTFV
jgi:hypothetical protein